MINNHLNKLQEIVDLLEGKERRVRTPDGARRFGQPVGSVIRTDKIPSTRKPSITVREGSSNGSRPERQGSVSRQSGSSRESAVREARRTGNKKFTKKKVDRRRNSDGDKYGVVNEFYLSDETTKIYKEGGIPTGVVREITNAEEFRSAIMKLKENNPYSSSVYVYDLDEYKDMRLFMYENGRAGFALKGDEIVSVFSYSDEDTRGAAHLMMALGIEEGGTRLDAFDTVLPKLYQVHGFEVAARIKFNEEYQPEGWDTETYKAFNNGKPDVVFMAYNLGNFEDYDGKSGEYVDDYDAGIEKAKDLAKRNQPQLGADEPSVKMTPGSKPSKPSERVTGSERNKPNSASRGGSISFGEQLTTALKNKVKDHNAKMREKGKPTWTYANLRALKAVARRGAGAFSTSHRPGMTRNQWAIARVNAFLYLLEKGKPKRVQYTVDYDLLPSGHPKASRGKKARMTPDTNAQRSAVNDKLQDALEDAIEELDLTKELSDEEIQALFDAFEDEDWTEVDRLTEMFEKRGTITADMVGEEKAGGIDRNRGQAENLRRYWTVGKGALKIRWGTEGDWTRCVRQLSKYLGPRAKGYCSLRHKEMNGIWPGDTGVPGPNPRKSLSFSQPIQWDTDYPEDSENQTKDTGAFMLEHKTVGVKGLNVVSEEEGIVETIISVTGIVDEVKDRIMPGAYAKTLAKRKPKGVWSHDWDSPVSKTLGVKELLPGDASLPKLMPNGEPWPKEAGALAVKTQFNLQTQRGKEAYADVVFFGDEQEWSIGYNVPVGGAKIDQKSGVREISTLELYEYSPVLFGAMPLARTTSVKEAQLALKQLRGGAASWLASQSTEVEIPEAEEGKEMGMLEDETDEMMDTEEKERMLSGEQMDLVKQAIEVLREILDVSQGEEKGYGKPMDEDEQDEKMGYGEDESDKKEIIGFDTLTEAIDTMVSDANLPQKMLEGMNTAAGAFDEAMKTKNMDALDVAGNQLLDMVENAMEGADDKTKGILRGIAVTLAEFIKKVTEDEDSQDDAPMDAEPVTEENVQKKETISIPLDELKNFLDSMKSE